MFNSLKPGRGYLVLGTLQQLLYNLPEGIIRHFMYHPTTLQIKEALTTPREQHEIIVIIPKVLSTTGLYTSTGNHRKQVTEYSLPSDQFFRISSSLYVFFICSALDGTPLSKEAKKITGGLYEILDCTSSVPNPMTISLLSTWYPFLDKPTLNDRLEAFELISSLADPSGRGVELWGKLSASEITKWFEVVNLEVKTKGYSSKYQYPVPLILSSARARPLYPYLKPFLIQMDNSSEHLFDKVAILERFATWVWCSTVYWAAPKGEGLIKRETSRGINKGKPFFTFTPSPKALQMWYNIFTK